MEHRLDRIAADVETLRPRIQANESYGKNDFESFVLSLLALKPQERVLDLGCGNGKFLLHFANAVGPGGSVVGLDLDSAALADAQHKLSGRGIAAQLVHGPMEQVGELCQGKNFDAACCSYALYYAKQPRLVIERVAALMAPAARLLVVGPHVGNNRELLDLLQHCGDSVAPAVDPNFMDDIVAPACRSLFRELKMVPFENQIRFPSVDAVLQYWRSSAYYKESMGERVRAQLTRHFSREGEFVIRKLALAILASYPVGA